MSRRPRIMYCWEMGEGLGHIAPFLPVAQELERRGYEMVYAIAHLAAMRGLFIGSNSTLLQAPYLATPVQAAPLFSFADILVQNGWDRAENLAGLLMAWRGLYEVVQPDLLITDHAPAAQAARHAIVPGGKLKHPPSVRLAAGFLVPHCATPMPNYINWIQPPPGQLEASDARCRDTVNAALARLGAPPVASLAQALDSEATLLATYPEFDPYVRPGAEYVGTIVSPRQGGTPEWPSIPGKRVFVYLSVANPQFGYLFDALRLLGWPTLMYAPGANPDLLNQTRAPNIRVLPQPVNMELAAAGADIGVNHGGHGTCCDFILAGTPVLTLPDVVERGITARQVEEHGLGLLVRTDSKGAQPIVDRLNRLANDVVFSQQIAAFLLRYADRTQQAIVERVADRCEELVRHQSQI